MTATLARPSVVPPLPASPAVLPPMSADLQAFRAGLVRFTWADLQKMWEAGILYEDSSIELLDGLLVYRDCGDAQGRPGVANSAHDWAVTVIGKLDLQIGGPDAHVRTQATLRLSEDYSPIPDAMILRGSMADFRRRQPTAADTWCVIEVADSSYRRDAGEKLAAYAAAGVGQYVIVDLRRRLAEVYADPAAGAYPPPLVVAADGSLALRAGDANAVVVPLAGLLP